MDAMAEVLNVSFAILASGLAGHQLADTWVVGSIFERPRSWLEKRRKTKSRFSRQQHLTHVRKVHQKGHRISTADPSHPPS